MITPKQARCHPCPKCGAAAGQFCKKVAGGVRGMNHAERAKAIRQAHLTKARAAVDAIPAEVWNYAKAFVTNLGRSPVVTGLTPREEVIGNRAFTSFYSNTSLLLEHHAKQRSISDIARDWGKSEETVERWYDEALTQFAIRLTPLVSGSCALCRKQMPEIISNQCLRCRDCRAELEALWRQRAPVTGVRSRSDTEEPMQSYVTLHAQPGHSMETIRRAYHEQLERLVWATSEGAPADIQAMAATARATINAAWDPVQRHRSH